MFNLDNIQINFSFENSFFIFIILLLLTAFFIFLSFKFTIPPISRKKKVILIFLRSLSFFSLLLALINPKISIVQKFYAKPRIYFFYDNSKSIRLKNFENNKNIISSSLNSFKNSKHFDNFDFYLFADSAKKLDELDLNNLEFNGVSTNFYNIFSFVDLFKKDAAALVIFSDGINNQGPEPLLSAKKLSMPLYCFQLGDPFEYPDVSVQKIIKPDVYNVNDTIQFVVFVNNRKLNGKIATINFLLDNKQIESKSVILSQNNLDVLYFNFVSTVPGEKKVTFNITPIKEEENISNNSQSFFINIQDNKNYIALVTSSLSPDYRFIKQALYQNKQHKIIDIAQISPYDFLYQDKNFSLLDSAKLFILINFPTNNTSENVLRKISDKINNSKTPYLIVISNLTDLKRLAPIEKSLPINVNLKNANISVQIAQPFVIKSSEQILFGNFASKEDWNNLPPSAVSIYENSPKKNSDVYAYIKVKGQIIEYPLLISSTNDNSKQFVINSSEIWRWKLQYANYNPELFDGFVNSVVKWLLFKEEDSRLTIDLNNKVINFGESLQITARAKDELGNPAINATIEINIKDNSGIVTDKFELQQYISGIYQGTYFPKKTGDFILEAKLFLDNKIMSNYTTKFHVSEAEIEKINLTADTTFMMKLAKNTGGKYFNNIQEINALKAELEKFIDETNIEKENKLDFSYWSSYYVLILALLLLSLEWFLRKKFGML